MEMLHTFEWYTLIPGLKLLQPHVAHALMIAAIIVLLSVVLNRRLARLEDHVLPSSRLNIVNFFDLIHGTVMNLMKELLGHHARHYLYLIGSLAIFILFSNLMGLFPGFAPPTDNINTTAACAIVVFLATHYYGVKTHGWGYLKQFTGPFWWLAWLMIPIEIISHLARPLSLSLRLFGNLMGDHLVTAIFVFMTVGLTKAIIGAGALAWPFALVSPLIPIAVMALGIFVAFVQTFVFILLSMTYIAGAVSDAH